MHHACDDATVAAYDDDDGCGGDTNTKGEGEGERCDAEVTQARERARGGKRSREGTMNY